MLTSGLRVSTLLDIGAAIQDVVYNVVETTCTVIFFTIIILHLCHCLHTSYCNHNVSNSEASNERANSQLVVTPSSVHGCPTSSDAPHSSRDSRSRHYSPRARIDSCVSSERLCTTRFQVLSNAACPSSQSFSSLEVDPEPLSMNSEKRDVVKHAKSAAPLRLSTFTPFIDSSGDSPLARSGPVTDCPQPTDAVAVPPPTDATPVRRLKTASVKFILFLAWKVLSQGRAVPQPRPRLLSVPQPARRITGSHLGYDAKVAIQDATLRSRCLAATPPVLDEAVVLPALTQVLSASPSLSDVSPPAELLVSASALPSGCGPTSHQDLRSRPRALILGKQLYGGRKLKSVRSQLDRTSRPRSASSPRQTFSSIAPTELVALDLCFNKLGRAVAVRRRNTITRRMLVAANARFSAPIA